MKSLEIVNRNIESVNEQLNDYDEEDDEEYGFFPTYDTLMQKLVELEIIKQDLEILDTLKALIIHNIKSVGLESAIRDYKVLVNTGELTQGQLNELLKWLEGK